MTATVIIATTGSPDLVKAVESVLNQTYDTICYVVCDGMDHFSKVAALAIDHNWTDNSRFKSCTIPINVGSNGFYGHRIYAAFTHLVNTKYVMYFDQDNIMDENHVQSCVDTIEKNDLQWSYSLRKIIDKTGKYECNDDCESLGKWQSYHGQTLIDTSCYCIVTEIAVKVCQVWHTGWGADRLLPSVLMQHFPKFDCTGEYTINYRVDGNPNSVSVDFFKNGNEVMNKKYNGKYPWKKS